MMMNILPEFSAMLSRDLISTLKVYEYPAETSSDEEDDEELLDSQYAPSTYNGQHIIAPSTMYCKPCTPGMSRRKLTPRLVNTQDLGIINHPGGDPYKRFTAQSSAQTPKLVPNHDGKSGYRSESSRDEAVCHAPGVFQVGTHPDVYPKGLNLPLPTAKPWSGLDISRWLPNGMSGFQSPQPNDETQQGRISP